MKVNCRRFIQRNEETRQFLNSNKAITNNVSDSVPETPYKCNVCSRTFKHLSALMRHTV